jgi:hypothetical protein
MVSIPTCDTLLAKGHAIINVLLKTYAKDSLTNNFACLILFVDLHYMFHVNDSQAFNFFKLEKKNIHNPNFKF